MAPITEIAILPLKPNVEWQDVLKSIGALIRSQPGCLQVRYSKKHENADHIVMFIDWEDISDHKAFIKSPAYGPMASSLGDLLTSPVAPYHATLEPFPPTVLDNDGGKGKTAVVEVIHAYFPADLTTAQEQVILARFQEFVDVAKPVAKGLSGETAHSFVLEELEFKGEKSRAFLGLLGWDSIAAHMAYRETDDFKNSIGLIRGLERLKGIEVFHVSNHII